MEHPYTCRYGAVTVINPFTIEIAQRPHHLNLAEPQVTSVYHWGQGESRIMPSLVPSFSSRRNRRNGWGWKGRFARTASECDDGLAKPGYWFGLAGGSDACHLFTSHAVFLPPPFSRDSRITSTSTT